MSPRIERIASHLQEAAAMREWILAHIPHAESTLGHDLFLSIGNRFIDGQALDLASLCAERPYPAADIRRQVSAWMQQGLLLASPAGADAVVPTARFLGLLEAYVDELERHYAPRRNLRRQLLVEAPAAQRRLVETLYDRFHDLGWLYLHRYGAMCFLMASLVHRVMRLHGASAQLRSGYLEIRDEHDKRYHLGIPMPVQANQIAGHAFCVIDAALIVDFGLGNLRRGPLPDFAWGLAGCYRLEGPVYGRLALPRGGDASWRGDWRHPDSEAEFRKFEPLVERLVRHYHARFGNTLPV